MHGFMQPAAMPIERRATFTERLRRTARAYRWMMAIVLLPTLIVAAYLYLFAADQYESEAHYIVRSQTTGSGSSSSGLSQILSLGASGGSASMASPDSLSVSDYLSSHDVVNSLRRTSDLVGMFRRPEADVLSELRYTDPTPETLLDFYKGQVSVSLDNTTGITTLRVRTFRPEDSFKLARDLLSLGEQRVNMMNLRAYGDAVSLSKRQLDEAESALNRLRQQMTGFRQTNRDINPTGSAAAQLGLVTTLQGSLSATQAQLSATAQAIGRDNPQYLSLVQRAQSLKAQIAAQSGKLAGGTGAIAAGLGDYEQLQMQQQFLSSRYESASAAYEAARQQAVRQQLYIVRVVEPNMPVKSLYPRRARIILTMFFALLVVYAIGWLIAAGVREHTA